jgi:hypothetical protein
MHPTSKHTATSNGAASLLVAALEHAWQTIRSRHPEVPEAVLIVASGSQGKRLNLGHFAPHRWQVAGADRHEVLVGGEGLQRGPNDVLGTLLHEAAHGLAQAAASPTPAARADTTMAAMPASPASSAWRSPEFSRSAGPPPPSRTPPPWPMPTSLRNSLPRWSSGAATSIASALTPLSQPARRHLWLRPSHPGRQSDPRPGAHPLRRLPATLGAGRPRRRQQLTIKHQFGRSRS